MSQAGAASQRRVSVRQAILLVAHPRCMRHGCAEGARRLSDLDLALLLDNLGIVVAVNGVTIGVVARSIADAALLSRALPHDVELFAPDSDAAESDQTVLDAMEEYRQRAFARIVAIRSDVIGLSVRIVSTGLTSLALADIVAGFTPHGDWYLAGVRSRASIETWRSLSSLELAEGTCRTLLGQATCQRGQTIRYVESLPCTAEFLHCDGLRTVAMPPAYVRTAALLRAT